MRPDDDDDPLPDAAWFDFYAGYGLPGEPDPLADIPLASEDERWEWLDALSRMRAENDRRQRLKAAAYKGRDLMRREDEKLAALDFRPVVDAVLERLAADFDPATLTEGDTDVRADDAAGVPALPPDEAESAPRAVLGLLPHAGGPGDVPAGRADGAGGGERGRPAA